MPRSWSRRQDRCCGHIWDRQRRLRAHTSEVLRSQRSAGPAVEFDDVKGKGRNFL